MAASVAAKSRGEITAALLLSIGTEGGREGGKKEADLIVRSGPRLCRCSPSLSLLPFSSLLSSEFGSAKFSLVYSVTRQVIG